MILELMMTLWFWAIVVITIGFVLSVYNDTTGFAVASIVIGGALAHFSTINVWHLLRDNFTSVLAYFAIYTALGIVWSFVRWYFYLVSERDTAIEYNRKVRIPKASENKDRIFTWIFCWPFSVLGNFFGDFLSAVYRAIMRIFGNTYDRIAQNIYKDLKADD